MIKPAYYMRDDHTFLELSLDTEEAIQQIKSAFDEGFGYGMLCCKNLEVSHSLHAQGDWGRFLPKAVAWLEKAQKVNDQRKTGDPDHE